MGMIIDKLCQDMCLRSLVPLERYDILDSQFIAEVRFWSATIESCEDRLILLTDLGDARDRIAGSAEGGEDEDETNADEHVQVINSPWVSKIYQWLSSRKFNSINLMSQKDEMDEDDTKDPPCIVYLASCVAAIGGLLFGKMWIVLEYTYNYKLIICH